MTNISFIPLIFIGLLWSGLFFGCRKKSDILIEEDKMVRILADLNISDQIIRKYPAVYRDSIRKVLTISLHELHNITQAELDTNLYLYQSDFEKYKRVSEKVLKYLEDIKSNQNSVQDEK